MQRRNNLADTIKDTVVEVVIAKITAVVPFLGIPGIKQIFTFLFKKIVNLIYDEMMVIGAFVSITVKTDAEKKKYEEAVEELKEAIETDNKETINESKENLKKHFHNLISIIPR